MNKPATPAQGFNILFVCTGNTCRSPMAQAIGTRAAQARGWDHVHVRSAGVAAFAGSVVSGGALRAAAKNGLDIADHQASQLTEELAEWAGLILVMSPAHLMRVVQLGAGDRAALLSAFASGAEGDAYGGSVPDPIGGDDEEYLATFAFLEELIERSFERIEPAVVE